MLAAAAGTGLITVALTGCQLGEYAMGGECQDLAGDVVSVIESGSAASPDVSDLWAGAGEYWCSFIVPTGLELTLDDPTRAEIKDRIDGLIAESTSGIRFEVTYGDAVDVFTTGPSKGH